MKLSYHGILLITICLLCKELQTFSSIQPKIFGGEKIKFISPSQKHLVGNKTLKLIDSKTASKDRELRGGQYNNSKKTSSKTYI